MKKRLCIVTLLFISLNSSGLFAHQIGEHYQGGIVFWVDQKGEHGLVASTEDQHYLTTDGRGELYKVSWAVDNKIAGANKDGIFSGAYNTNRMIEAIPSNTDTLDIAGSMAASYMGGEYGDWYLPSKYELNLMYEQRVLLQLNAVGYWSSTEIGIGGGAWVGCFRSGNYCNKGGTQEAKRRDEKYSVRAIRAF